MKQPDNIDKTNFRRNRKWGQSIFLICLFTFPILHKLLFYFGTNFRSIMLAFQKYDTISGQYEWYGLKNFLKFFSDIKHTAIIRSSMKNTLILYLFETFLIMPINILCAFFVVKKVPGSGLLKVVFFLPGIISAAVLVLIFKYFVEYGLADVYKTITGNNLPLVLIEYPYAFPMILTYALWSSFASGIVLYVGTMTRVSDGIEDAAKIDGVSIMGELWHIILPTIYPMLTVFYITGFVGIFIGTGPVFTFYIDSAPEYTYTMGYYLFTRVVGKHSSITDYPYAAAVGLTVTLIATPLTFLLKYLLERFGPNEN